MFKKHNLTLAASGSPVPFLVNTAYVGRSEQCPDTKDQQLSGL